MLGYLSNLYFIIRTLAEVEEERAGQQRGIGLLGRTGGLNRPLRFRPLHFACCQATTQLRLASSPRRRWLYLPDLKC